LDVAQDKFFWFLDICDKKNINFPTFIVYCCTFCLPYRLHLLQQILQRYNAKIYEGEKMISMITNEFEVRQINSRKSFNFVTQIAKHYYIMMSAIDVLCKYSNGKYKYIDDHENNFDETLEDICKEVNLSVSGIVMREFNVNLRFAIIIMNNVSTDVAITCEN